MKIFNIILAILFALFAYVQINDPDPWLWVLLYGFVAVVSVLAAFRKYFKYAIMGGMAGCVLGIVFLLPDFLDWINMGTPNIAESMKTEKPHIEFVREFLGLAIAFAALLFHSFQERKLANQ